MWECEVGRVASVERIAQRSSRPRYGRLRDAVGPADDHGVRLHLPPNHPLRRVFREGRWLNYPVNYNPVFFYGGLALLALSFVLSAIPS